MIKIFKLINQTSIVGIPEKGLFKTKIHRPLELKEWVIESSIMQSITAIPFMPKIIEIYNKDIIYSYDLNEGAKTFYRIKLNELINQERILH